MTKREQYGLVIRPLTLSTQDRFRHQSAARPGMTQPKYLEALLDLAEGLRDIAETGNDSVSARAVLERHGLGRVSV